MGIEEARMAVPAQCTKCGTIFWSRAFNVSFAVEARLVGCRELCIDPKCGGEAVVAEGVFNATQDALEIFSAPDVTKSMLATLKRKISEKKYAYSSLEELQSDIAAIHPSFGRLFMEALKRPDIAISVALTLIQIWISLAQDEPIQVKNVFFGPTTIVERPLHHQATPAPKTPPSKPSVALQGRPYPSRGESGSAPLAWNATIQTTSTRRQQGEG
jgi:hypothetical protein